MANKFDLDVSYGQISVFLDGLDDPFNDWTERHVTQGFSWRHGSVSFRTLVESGLHRIEVHVVDKLPALQPNTMRAIEVPFHVPLNGDIDIASIADEAQLSLSAGCSVLRCEMLDPKETTLPTIHLVFACQELPRFSVPLADGDLSGCQDLLTTAQSAR